MTFGRPFSQKAAGHTDFVEKVQRRVRLRLSDGSEVEGYIHIGKLHRVLDFLNQESFNFIPVTEAVALTQGRFEPLGFLAVSKAHIVAVSEIPD